MAYFVKNSKLPCVTLGSFVANTRKSYLTLSLLTALALGRLSLLGCFSFFLCHSPTSFRVRMRDELLHRSYISIIQKFFVLHHTKLVNPVKNKNTHLQRSVFMMA